MKICFPKQECGFEPRRPQTRIAAWLLGLLLLGAGPPALAQSLPGVSPRDTRVAVDAGQMPWRAVGRVQTELGGRCTGFMVAPDVMLTAAHCLFLRAPHRFVQPGSVHVLLGYAAGRFMAHAVARAFTLSPAYDPDHEAQTAGADWAVLHLVPPIGTPGSILARGDGPVLPGQPAVLGGYGQDRAEVLLADPGCRVVGAGADGQRRALLRHDCAGTRGTSGAPLLARGPDGAWRVLGIQILADRVGAGGVAVPIGAVPPR